MGKFANRFKTYLLKKNKNYNDANAILKVIILLDFIIEIIYNVRVYVLLLKWKKMFS